MRLSLYFAASGDWVREPGTGSSGRWFRVSRRENILIGLLHCTDHRCLSALLAVEDGQVIDRALDWLAIAFWDEKGNRDQHVPDDAVLAITEQLAIDLDAAWRKEALGENLTQRYFELHDKTALAEIAARCGPSHPHSSVTKDGLVKALAGRARLLKPPAELMKPKKPKG